MTRKDLVQFNLDEYHWRKWWVDHPEEADGWVSYSERTALKVTLLGHAAGGVLAGVKCTNNVGS